MMGPHTLYEGNRISHMQLMIMLTIRNERKYGYEILKELRDIFEGIWEPKTGAIYPAIRKLQEHGLVKVEMIDDKEYYSLSENGQIWLKDVVHRIGGMASIGIRFMTVILKAYEEMGFEKEPMCDIHDGPEEGRLDMMIMMRDAMESDIRTINKLIEKAKVAKDGEHN